MQASPSQQPQATGQWQPNQQWLLRVLSLYRRSGATATNEEHKQIFQELERMKTQPEFCNYLVFVLVHCKTEIPALRQRAGLSLNLELKKNWRSMPAVVKNYVRNTVVGALGDPAPGVRSTAGTVVTTICVASHGVEHWPGLLEHLVGQLRGSNPHMMAGALVAVRMLCEELTHNMTQKMGRALDTLIPGLIGLFTHSDPVLRKHSLAAVSEFLTEGPPALYKNLDKYMTGLFALTKDPSPEIQMSVCRSFGNLLERRLDYMAPHMEGILRYITHTCGSEDEEVALAACEFWPVYCEVKGTDMTLLAKHLPNVIPVLMKGMRWHESEALGSYEDTSVPDRAQDIAPRFHTAKTATFGDDHDNGYDSESDDEEWEDMSDWNLRKCSAASLDTLAKIYRNSLLPMLLKPLKASLGSPQWNVRESGILALGAVAEGCFTGLEPYLGQLVPYLMKLLRDPEPLVRSISCWSLSRYSKWIMQNKDDNVYFKPLIKELLTRIVDKNKRVQEAACSAFATLEEVAQLRLLNYLGPILQNLMFAFNRYQARNLLILYDCLTTLAEAVGHALNNPVFIKLLMPPLIAKWNELRDDDRNIFPLLECLTAVAQALKTGFAPFAPPVFNRCIKIIGDNLQMQQEAVKREKAGLPADLPDKEFIVCALDLLSGLAEGLGPSIESFVAKSNCLALLYQCVTDLDPDVRQSGFALLGDLAKSCIGHLQPHLDKFILLAAKNLNPRFSRVCNNASWAIGEIAVKIGAKMKPSVPLLMEYLISILAVKGAAGMRALMENTGITIGRLALVCPDAVAPFLPSFVDAWLFYLAGLPEDVEKQHAFRGMCAAVSKNPQAVIPFFPRFCHTIAMWKQPNAQMVQMFGQVLHSFKNMLKAEWPKHFKGAAPQVQQYLVQTYKL